jgi:hypothetical protein
VKDVKNFDEGGTSDAEFGLKTPGEIKHIGGYGKVPTVTEAVNTIQTAREQYLRDLEERYKRPNWWQVAQAFGRPHMGGGIEALGDVGGVLGQWAENQRRMVPTISRMRAEMAAYNLPIEQQKAALALTGKGEMLDPSQQAQVIELTSGPGTVPEVQRAATENVATLIQAAANLRSQYAEWVKTYGKPRADGMLQDEFIRNPGLKRFYSQPAGNIPAPSTGTTQPPPSEPAPTPVAAAVKPKAFSPGIPSLEEFVNQGYTDEEAREQRGIRTEQIKKNRTEFGLSKRNADDIMKDAMAAYSIASNPKLKDLFAIGKSGSPLDQLISLIEETPPTQAVLGNSVKNIASRFRLKGDSLNQIQTLTNLLNSLRAKLTANPAIVGEFQNPTDLRTEIEAGITPTMTDTQTVFLRNLAKIVSDAKARGEYFGAHEDFINKPRNDVMDFVRSDEYNKILERNTERINNIISRYPDIDPKTGKFQEPDWFRKKQETGKSEAVSEFEERHRKRMSGKKSP